jgi:AcrR family transcriptional regulator
MSAAGRTSTRGAPVRRLGGRSARVRRAVFDAALEQVVEGGYQALTVESVAAAAGVNKTTIYRNWPSKAKLVQAAAEDRSQQLIATEASGDPERDLVALLTSVSDYIESPIGQALVIATLSEANDPEVRRARADFWDHRFQAARDVVRAAAPDGRALDDADVDAVIEHLIGPLFLRAFVTGAPLDRAFIERTAKAGAHLASHAATRRADAGSTSRP